MSDSSSCQMHFWQFHACSNYIYITQSSLLYRCRIEFSNVSEECSLCLAYEASVTNTTECSTLLASNYEQTFGLMIISKKELKNPTADRFNNHSMIRGFLTASVMKFMHAIYNNELLFTNF